MAILFDLDGTILGARRKKSEVRAECAKKFGLNKIDNEEYYKILSEVLHNQKIDSRVPVFRQLIGDEKLARKVAEEYRVKSLENAFVYPDATEALETIELKKGLVTNGPRLVQWDKIRKFNLERYFDSIAISGEIGKSKPEKEIFMTILRSLNSTPEESLYVGNVPELDVLGAKNAGMVSVLIEREDDSENGHYSTNMDPDYVIKTLTELSRIIEREELH